MKTRHALAAIVLLVAGLGGCASLPGLGRQSPLLARVDDALGEDWYGVYLEGRKLGHARTYVEFGDDGAIVIGLELRARLVAPAGQFDLDVSSYQVFAARAPHRFLRSRTERSLGGQVERVTIQREGSGVWATVLRDGQEQRTRAALDDYTLEDVLRQDLWLLERPEAGSELEMRVFDGQEIRLVDATVSVRTTHDMLLEGVPIHYSVLSSIDADGDRVVSVVDQSARVLGLQLADHLRLQLEPREVALRTDEARQLLIGATVPVDRPLGERARVARLQLSARGGGVERLGSGPGQRVEHDRFGGRWVVSVEPGERLEPAPQAWSAPRIASELAARLDVLLEEAVGGLQGERARVEALLAFVAGHLDDALQLDPIPLDELLDRRRGDASEHAQLFVALAERAGLGARPVSGLLYLGDEQRAFGPHAWADVAIDGVWVPVDPTWVQLPVDATHLRFAHGPPSETGTVEAGDLALQVLAVDFAAESP